MRNINNEINYRKITKVEITTQKCLDIKKKTLLRKIITEYSFKTAMSYLIFYYQKEK